MVVVAVVETVAALRTPHRLHVGRVGVDQFVALEVETAQERVGAAVVKLDRIVAAETRDGPGVEINPDVAQRRRLALHDRTPPRCVSKKTRNVPTYCPLSRYRADDSLTGSIRVQSSGRSLAIREWMTRPEAAACAVCDTPRLSREALSDLRMIVDRVVRSRADDGGNDDAQLADDTDSGSCSNPDGPGHIPEGERKTELLALLAQLIREAVTNHTEREGDGHERDHA